MKLKCWFYKGREAKGKGGEIKFKFPPQKATPRIQDLGGNSWHSWNTLGERIMAGQVQMVQVAGRPPPMAGRPVVERVNANCWLATQKRWPPMCAQHKYEVKTKKM